MAVVAVALATFAALARRAYSLLLQQVRNKIERASESFKVEEMISGWRKVDGQQIQGNITRTEVARLSYHFRLLRP